MPNNNEPVFFLEKKNGDVYEPLYIPPSMGDECMHMSDLNSPTPVRTQVRINGKLYIANVLSVEGDGLYIPWSEWERVT